MAKIFLSYRRKESTAMAGRIYDRLRSHFGEDAVFIDLDSIPIGVDFRKHIASEMDQCAVLLAVIGRNWAGETNGGRRLEDPRDLVRIEVEAALGRDLPVIPILIDRATMPSEADLPPSLASLAYRNAIDVDQGRDFHHHVDRLIKGIERFLPSPSAGPAVAAPQKPRSVDGPTWTNSIDMKFVRIEPGEFLMGSPDSDSVAAADEKPQHRVRISKAFYLGIHEVTQGDYQAVTGENPSHFKGSSDLPVERVSWLDAVRFCNKLSERERRDPFYNIDGAQVTIAGGNGYRLPTEAEWEYACRAGTSTSYPFGDDAAALGEYAWYVANSDGKTHPVGKEKPTPWGLYDMLGNVWEWCGDWYAKKCYESSPVTDPPGAAAASARVIRGGSWSLEPRDCRSANRSRNAPGARDYDLGFRVARDQE
jgi:formylglycine-generating enzyme required for sulfatase activity